MVLQFGKPIIGIRAGHGGIHPVTKKYTTTDSKFWIHSKDLPIDLHETLPDGRKVFYEGVWNRMIADKVSVKLKEKGIPHILFHHEFMDIPITEQSETINDVHKAFPIALTLELHSNAFNTKAKGFEIYTSPGQTKSDRYAELLWEIVAKQIPQLALRADKSDGDHDKETKLWMTTKTNCPTILPEFGFFDNEEDILIMMDPKIIEIYVSALAQVSAIAYLEAIKK